MTQGRAVLSVLCCYTNTTDDKEHSYTKTTGDKEHRSIPYSSGGWEVLLIKGLVSRRTFLLCHPMVEGRRAKEWEHGTGAIFTFTTNLLIIKAFTRAKPSLTLTWSLCVCVWHWVFELRSSCLLGRDFYHLNHIWLFRDRFLLFAQTSLDLEPPILCFPLLPEWQAYTTTCSFFLLRWNLFFFFFLVWDPWPGTNPFNLSLPSS
jgi:hypothetical protein